MACSGGIDSMVLTHCLQVAGYRPALAHCNFKLRKEDADADAAFVKKYAHQNKLAYYSRQFNTTEYAKTKGISIQMAARELRYDFFEELMEREKLDYLLTAHHADDAFETILINLGRGSSLLSLAGINPAKAKILRPLWLLSKDEIIRFALTEKIKWREDLSNQSQDYQRNYIRHQVLHPLVKKFSHFASGFQATLRQTQRDRQLFEKLLAEKLAELLEEDGDMQKMPLAPLRDEEIRQNLLYHWLKPYGPFDIKAVSEACQQAESGKIFETSSHRLLLDRHYLVLQTRPKTITDAYIIDQPTQSMNEPLSLTMEKIPATSFKISKDAHTAGLDFERLKFPLLCEFGMQVTALYLWVCEVIKS
ncbi:MAG: tRNA lysidine(34) synthetase TilS [Owenweeksia sp.]|nr:tRNA lysidine(34) synthetase TilS [Owenweeksia sp.]